MSAVVLVVVVVVVVVDDGAEDSSPNLLNFFIDSKCTLLQSASFSSPAKTPSIMYVGLDRTFTFDGCSSFVYL